MKYLVAALIVISSALCSAASAATATAGQKLGINLSMVCDYCYDYTFVDVMKQARGFATLDVPFDPTNHPVPLDANGWPTTDFAVYFAVLTDDPLDPSGTSRVSMNPTFYNGKYTLSFTGHATVAGTFGCCTVENQSYNARNNTTTALVTVKPTFPYLALNFTNTLGKVKNIKLLRPGYPLGTTQTFTTPFLKQVAPFGALRLIDFSQTVSSPVKKWSDRTRVTAPTQSGPTGVAWEYAIELANTTGKDIWINIPASVDLSDSTSNNYVTQLAKLLKAKLKPRIHVYVEYGNELWNHAYPFVDGALANLEAAKVEVANGDPNGLNYDGCCDVDTAYPWAYRRVVSQLVRISQLFAAAYGTQDINSTVIRPVYMAHLTEPAVVVDTMNYMIYGLNAQPNYYFYGMGGAPYFDVPRATYDNVDSLFTSITASVNAQLSLFSGIPYFDPTDPTGATASLRNLADYNGLKSIYYEGGPDISMADPLTLVEQANSDPRMGQLITTQISDYLGCGGTLYNYYRLSGPPSVSWGAYRDPALPTAKSQALNKLAATPLSSFTQCVSVPTAQ